MRHPSGTRPGRLGQEEEPFFLSTSFPLEISLTISPLSHFPAPSIFFLSLSLPETCPESARLISRDEATLAGELTHPVDGGLGGVEEQQWDNGMRSGGGSAKFFPKSLHNTGHFCASVFFHPPFLHS